MQPWVQLIRRVEIDRLDDGHVVTLRVWNLTGARPVLILAAHANLVTAVTILRDGRTMVSGSIDGTLKIWDLAGGRAAQTLVGHTGFVAAAVTPDGRHAVSGSADRTLRVWDLANGEVALNARGP